MIIKTHDFNTIRFMRIEIFNRELGMNLEDIFDEDDSYLDQYVITDSSSTVGAFRLRDFDENLRKKLRVI